MKPKIVVTKNLQLYDDQKERLESLGDVTYYDVPPHSAEEWLERCNGVDIVCTGIFGLKSDKAYELKNVFISLPFVGVEFLDKQRLKERGIIVANAPGCNKEAVAEWIIAMILMHFRQLHTLTRTTQPKEKIINIAPGLWNKNITILGKGNIGVQLGKICEAFGMNVIFFERGDNLTGSVKDADIVANCLSVNETTLGLLDKKFFSSLKKGVFFVSASRHNTYDIEALKESLNNNIVSWVADDAADIEAWDVDDLEYKNLLAHPKILATPHIAWNADSEKRRANDLMIDNIEAWLKKKPINLIY